MIGRSALALAAMLAGFAPAHAQKIPGGDMPGRERDRFTANPAEKLMTQPQSTTSGPLPRIGSELATKRKPRPKPR